MIFARPSGTNALRLSLRRCGRDLAVAQWRLPTRMRRKCPFLVRLKRSLNELNESASARTLEPLRDAQAGTHAPRQLHLPSKLNALREAASVGGKRRRGARCGPRQPAAKQASSKAAQCRWRAPRGGQRCCVSPVVCRGRAQQHGVAQRRGQCGGAREGGRDGTAATRKQGASQHRCASTHRPERREATGRQESAVIRGQTKQR